MSQQPKCVWFSLWAWLLAKVSNQWHKTFAVQKSVRGDKESTTKHDVCVCLSHTFVGQERHNGPLHSVSKNAPQPVSGSSLMMLSVSKQIFHLICQFWKQCSPSGWTGPSLAGDVLHQNSWRSLTCWGLDHRCDWSAPSWLKGVQLGHSRMSISCPLCASACFLSLENWWEWM